MRAQSALPWLCVGDFNEVLMVEEHIGGNDREAWQMAAFQDVVDDCHLTDLGYHGLPYTWDNRQDGSRNVKVHLDHALGDNKFMERLRDTEVYHIPLTESDHCGLLVEVREKVQAGGRHGRRRSKPFPYENMWKSHGEYKEFVNRAWDLGPGSFNLSAVSSAILSLQSSLKSWDREVFGSVKQQVRVLRDELETERSHSLYRGPSDREHSVMSKLSGVLAREETME
jgi:hypothetical protein